MERPGSGAAYGLVLLHDGFVTTGGMSALSRRVALARAGAITTGSGFAKDRARFSPVIAREGRRSSIPETVVIQSRGRGVLDRPVNRAMTVENAANGCLNTVIYGHTIASSRRNIVRALLQLCASDEQRAQGMPGAR